MEIQDAYSRCLELSHGASSELFRYAWHSYGGIADPRSKLFMDLACLKPAARNLVGGAFLRMSQA